MIETPAARAKRIKAEEADRAARAAKYAADQARQRAAALPPAANSGEDQPFTRLSALSFTASINRQSESLATMLLEAHRRKIWEALGIPDWKTYVAEKLNFSRQHAYRLLTHAETVESLEAVSPRGDTLPRSEKQTRPLKNLSAPKQRKAWQRAVKAAGGAQPTGKQVATAVAALKPAKARVVSTEPNLPMHAAPAAPEPKCCPTCKRPLP